MPETLAFDGELSFPARNDLIKRMKVIKLRKYIQERGKSTCGPASLRIVLDYFGVKKDEKELVKLCRTTKYGTSAKNIRRAAVNLGFDCLIKDGASFYDIEKLLDKKIPVIVDWFSRGSQGYGINNVPVGHYSVVVGLNKRFIYINDPQIGKVRRVERNDFMSVWFDYEGNFPSKKKGLILRRIIVITPKKT